MEQAMPLLRYFIFVGGALIALLFAINAVLPPLPASEPTQTAAADLPLIRIHSDRKWPAPVVFDTSVPASAPVVTAAAETAKPVADAPVPEGAADISAKMRVREAFAQFPPPAGLVKVEPKTPPKHKFASKAAVKRAGPPVVLVAQQPQFGFFR
jgi:hypothetical protein